MLCKTLAQDRLRLGQQALVAQAIRKLGDGGRRRALASELENAPPATDAGRGVPGGVCEFRILGGERQVSGPEDESAGAFPLGGGQIGGTGELHRGWFRGGFTAGHEAEDPLPESR